MKAEYRAYHTAWVRWYEANSCVGKRGPKMMPKSLYHEQDKRLEEPVDRVFAAAPDPAPPEQPGLTPVEP